MRRTRTSWRAALSVLVLLWGCSQAPPSMRETAWPSVDRGAGVPQRSVQVFGLEKSPPQYTWFNVNYHRISGCYAVGNQRARFHVLSPSGGREQWDLLAQTVVPRCTTTIQKPVRGDWYAYPLAVDQKVQIIAKFIPSGTFGYIVVWRTADAYYIYGRNFGPKRLEPGAHDATTWSDGGKSIGIGVRNPLGEPSWLSGQGGVLFTVFTL